MLIWEGRGIWILPIAVVILFGSLFAFDAVTGEEGFINSHPWAKIFTGIVAGLSVLVFSRKFCSEKERRLFDEETGELVVIKPKHSLFFVKVRYWSLIIPSFFAIAVFAKDSKPAWWDYLAFREAMVLPVGEEVTLFAPRSISDGMYQRNSAISTDQKHFLYTLRQGSQSRILHVLREEKVWQAPRTMDFGGAWRDLDPAFQPGTLDLFFTSDRPLPGEKEAGDFNLWHTQWEGDQWLSPRPVPGVNTPDDEFYPSLTRSGTLYFTSDREDGVGGDDIWYAIADGDGFHPPVVLGPEVNTAADEYNAAVDSNGSYLFFGSSRKDDGLGGGDLYLSHRDGDGAWGEGALLGAGVNSPQLDDCPFYDENSGVLWFTSTRPLKAPLEVESLEAMRNAWQSSGNGAGDLYRVKIDLEPQRP